MRKESRATRGTECRGVKRGNRKLHGKLVPPFPPCRGKLRINRRAEETERELGGKK